MTEPLRFSFDLDCAPEHAFRVWASRIDVWWPRDHTLGPAVTVVLEEGVGGRIYETDARGLRYEWGEVTAWEPPTRLAYTWHLGCSAADATDVEVRFSEADGGTTRVEIEHGGWERLAERADLWQDRNQIGWDTLLPHFVKAIGRND